MEITARAKAAVVTFDRGAIQTEHYEDRMACVIGILNSSGVDGYKKFRDEYWPEIQAGWETAIASEEETHD